MITFGRVSTETCGPNLDPIYYENVLTCAVGGNKIRAGSPCDL